MAIDYFIDALQDGDIRLRFKQGKPTSITEAVNMVIELEALQLAEKNRMMSRVKGYVRMSKVDDDYQVLKHKIACIEKQLKKISTEKKYDEVVKELQRQSTSRSGRKSVRCWRCNEMGHYFWVTARQKLKLLRLLRILLILTNRETGTDCHRQRIIV